MHEAAGARACFFPRCPETQEHFLFMEERVPDPCYLAQSTARGKGVAFSRNIVKAGFSPWRSFVSRPFAARLVLLSTAHMAEYHLGVNLTAIEKQRKSKLKYELAVFLSIPLFLQGTPRV